MLMQHLRVDTCSIIVLCSRYMSVRLLGLNFTGNGYKKVKFHVQGNISNYTTDQIGIIKETVVAIVGCEGEDIHLDGFLNSDSFFVVLSMTERYVNGLFNMNQQDKEKLVNLNIDYFIIDSDHINLKNPKGSFCSVT